MGGGRRTRRVPTVPELPEAAYWELALHHGPPENFSSDDERRRSWFAHRGQFATNPGTRAAGWWLYESPEPRGDGPEHLQLERMGVLTAEERAFLRGWRAMGVIDPKESEDVG